MSQREPKGSQREPKGSQKGANGSQKGAKREPKVSQIQHKINIKDKVAKTMEESSKGLETKEADLSMQVEENGEVPSASLEEALITLPEEAPKPAETTVTHF